MIKYIFSLHYFSSITITPWELYPIRVTVVLAYRQSTLVLCSRLSCKLVLFVGCSVIVELHSRVYGHEPTIKPIPIGPICSGYVPFHATERVQDSFVVQFFIRRRISRNQGCGFLPWAQRTANLLNQTWIVGFESK